MVRRLEPHTMPAVSVECGVNCLPPYVARNINKPVGGVKGFGHRTIRDYAHAYSSGRITPTQV